jgi:hypothetical protein
VTTGLEKIALPPLVRPDVSEDKPNDALVSWGTTYYTYSVIAHLQTVLRGLVELIQLGNVSAAFIVCRHVFEWTAHTCYMSRHLKNYIGRQEWGRASHLQAVAMEGNRWIKDHGKKYDAPAVLDGVPDPLAVANIVSAYEEYQNQTYGKRDVKDSYGLLSEHSHPNSACFNRYCKFSGAEVRFIKPSTDASILGEERCLIDLVQFLDNLLLLGKERKIHPQIRGIITEIIQSSKGRSS